MDNGILWADYWSLAEQPGHLRLKGFRPIKEGGFFRAGNTLISTLPHDDRATGGYQA
ncbi:hypothetical protein [Paenibacillus sp. 276b]|uniref:hypothetical protein n=1 Tax=Paenibacillus sp. 276b TaxID=1566277 RepID=UPI0015A156E2|nr:hypothetical protein [Paenibacillus sp. 276b]